MADGHPMRGAVLLGAVLIVSMLMVLALLSLSLATQEAESVNASREEAAVRSVAEAGIERILQWFHDPDAVPDPVPRELFIKRYARPGEGHSFFDAAGRSQLRGDSTHPDLLLDAGRPEHEGLLYRSQGGRVLALRLYGPERPGFLGTVRVTAAGRRISRTFGAQLRTQTLPPLRAAIQLGAATGAVAPGGTAAGLPLWVHWGDVKIAGDARLGSIRDLPEKTVAAPVTGRSYDRQAVLEDRWLDFFIGGEAILTPMAGSSPGLPAHVHPHREPLPGLDMDPWDYDALKQAARRFGRYYVLGRDGLLHGEETGPDAAGRPPEEIFGSETVGEHHGLVFVDTPDRRAPTAPQLPTLRLTAPYAEGVFVMNAHILWQPRGAGQPLPAVSPPSEGGSYLDERRSVELSGVNLQGVLVTPGDLIVSGRPRVYGGLSVGGTLRTARSDGSRLEIWYDHELDRGQVRGMPLVELVPGTLQAHP